MTSPNELRPEEVRVANELRKRAHALDPFIPPAPSFDAIENPPLRVQPVRQAGFGASRELPMGLGAVVLAGALVVTFGLWGASSGMTSSSPKAPPTMTAAPSLSAATQTPRTSATRATIPSATLPPVVFRAISKGMGLAWSPGGSRLAVITENGSSRTITILDRSGRTLESFSGQGLAWIDDDAYLLVNETGFVAGRVGSPSHEQLQGHFRQMVAGTGGAVALVLDETGRDEYQLWRDGKLGPVRDGVPSVFSRDGSMLAVVHYPRSCCAGGDPAATLAPGPTTLDIVDTATGRSIARNSAVSWAYGAYLGFSPDGHYVAFDMDPLAGQRWGRLGILEILTGKLWSVGTREDSPMAIHMAIWTSSQRVLVEGEPAALPVDLPVTVDRSTIDGSSVDNPLVFPGPDGTWAAIRPSSNKVTITTPDRERTIDLPDVGIFGAWASDGSVMAVVCGQLSANGDMQLVLVRP